MINSVTSLDMIQPNMDKFNAATAATKFQHRNDSLQHGALAPTRAYLTFVTNASSGATLETANATTALMATQPQVPERVKVQHLENHTKLQNNNCWNNFRTLYNLSASSASIPKVEKLKHLKGNIVDGMQQKQQQPNLDIQNISAFNIEFNKRNMYSNINIIQNTKSNSLTAAAIEAIRLNNSDNKNHQMYVKQENILNREQQTALVLGPLPHKRTEDQEHAYRRIESVHNYAKLKAYDDEDEDLSPHGSRNSSYLDDEDDYNDEDDDEDDAGDGDEEYNEHNGAYGAGDDEMIDLDADYEDILSRRRFPTTPSSAVASGKSTIKPSMERSQSNQHTQQNEDEIDVETVEHSNNTSIGIKMDNHISGGACESSVAKPDHHARRPMNAFLIFCKRHRAIVKERYKNLENRAITKILGDWWASLDVNDKKSFTSLAQQNKDAFFSANPDFKWYKLPAPPLRTLNTRPSNATCSVGMENEDSHTFCKSLGLESMCNNTRSGANYFKLADEAQMGDLSQLMQDKARNKQCALQQALGETSQFMSAHLTGDTDPLALESNVQANQRKRHHYNENSVSSNSSEEDGLIPKKNSARLCKGKRYQELMNSGQITAPAVKKSKSTQRLEGGEASNVSPFLNVDMRRKFAGLNEQLTRAHNSPHLNARHASNASSPDADNIYSYDYTPFDLEEKIKELPALCLDEYLQRKRNTKKKKKFSSNGKKRGGNRNNHISCQNKNVTSGSATYSSNLTNKMPAMDIIRMAQRKQQQQAVGSQKRKARKESITRRDVSAIEQEVASLLPLTINGYCYFQEAPLSLEPSYNNDIVQKDIKPDKFLRQATSPIIPMITATTTITSPLSLSSPSSASPASTLTPSSSSSVSPASPQQSATAVKIELLSDTSNDNISSSSTSDLLILAEVAANRTE